MAGFREPRTLFQQPVKEIADVLGHRSLESTTIYAKLDLPSLARVAIAWPGGAE
jgi:site-specific recombinase XerC